MDIIRPDIIWISGRCYRVNKTIDSVENTETKQSTQYLEEDLYGDDDDEDFFHIEQIDRNRFKSNFHVAQGFHAVIIGSKGSTKKRIEAETKTQIKIPKAGESGDIEITGTNRGAVSAARRRIDLIVLSSRLKQQSTHFTCVPVIQQGIKENFLKFKQEILSGPAIFGLEEALFQSANKLHITFFTLCLMDNQDRELASQLLQDCLEHIVKPILKESGSIQLKMCGVAYMNDDPSEVDVLYGKVESPSLQKIADEVTEYFVSAGLIQRQYDHVKLHVTLINTHFRNNTEGDAGKNQLPHARKTFDARDILKKYVAFEFGSQTVSEIHLSQRFSTANDKFFEATGVLKIS